MQQINNMKQDNDRRNYTRWLGVGIEFCGVMGIFCYIGYKADEAFNSSPWFLLTGFFVGFAGMFYTIIKEGRHIGRK
jgi:F0F1-type ATP synthase assembly protein I